MAFFTHKQDHREEKVKKHFLSEWSLCRNLHHFSPFSVMDESEGGFPFCPSSQVSKLQDPSEWSGPTVLIHWCYFSSQMYPYGALFHYSGEKQRSPLPNLTRKKKIIIIIILETFYWQKTVCALRTVYEEERTHSSCCPWFLNQVRGCMDRTRSCFCVSSSTQYPPDLYSVCGSLSHSLEDRENVKLLKHYHFKDSFTQIKKTFCGLSRVIRPLFLEQHSLFQCWRVIL